MPVYTMELTDGRRIKLEASSPEQAVDVAELYEKGGKEAVDARYGDMSYGDAAVLRGMAGLTASLSVPAAAGVDYLKGKFTGDDRTYQQQLAEKRALLDNARERAGVGWEIGGGVAGAFIPGLGGASNLLRGGTGVANMMGRAGLGAAEGAAYGGVQAASEGDNVASGAAMGGALGGLGSLAAQAGRKVLSPAQNKLVGRIKRQVGTLKKEGVSVPASTQNQSAVIGNLERQATRMFPSGGRDVVGQSYDDFTRAVASKLDDSARTADDIGPAFWDRVGNKFDEGYDELRRSGSVTVVGPVSGELDRIKADLGWMGLTSGQERKVIDEIDRLKGFGILDGRGYQETHQRLSKLIRDQKGGSEMRGVLIEIQSALADGFRSNNPALESQARRMRSQYRLYKQIEPAVDPRTGKIDPHKLYRSVKRSEGDRRYLRGKGALTPLSEAGSALIRQPSTSNTAENLVNAGMLGGLGAGALAAAQGHPAVLGTMAAAAGGRALADSYLTSGLGQRHLKAQWASGPYGRLMADRIGQAAARGGVNATNELSPDQLRLLGGR